MDKINTTPKTFNFYMLSCFSGFFYLVWERYISAQSRATGGVIMAS